MDGASNGLYYAAYMSHFDPKMLMFQVRLFREEEDLGGESENGVEVETRSCFPWRQGFGASCYV
jgi:hypothetical protein